MSLPPLCAAAMLQRAFGLLGPDRVHLIGSNQTNKHATIFCDCAEVKLASAIKARWHNGFNGNLSFVNMFAVSLFSCLALVVLFSQGSETKRNLDQLRGKL